jgi:glutamate-1-semialdehyde 2,1-aminomutase
MQRSRHQDPKPAVRALSSEDLREKAHELIPGGCHTYAKGDDQYPTQSPGFIVRGEGCRVWDRDGREFIEYGMGLRTVVLGHAFPEVVQAVERELRRGSNFTRPSPIEVECAEDLLELVPAADMVKFAKNGSDTTTAAIRLSRAFTGRDMVGICADHPFFSTDDWFIGATVMKAGIPEAVQRLTVSFRFNDPGSVQALFDQYRGKIAALIMEPATSEEPTSGFLSEVHRLCQEEGALLVLDEMITGFRWGLGGGQGVYGVEPDLSTFGKSLGNGFSVSALVGKREIMELGGLRHGGERVFLLSTTHGGETHALAAAVETMRVFRERGVVEVLCRQGERLREGAEQSIRARGLEPFVQIRGRASNLIHVTRDSDGGRSQGFRTLLLQELLKRGVLAPSFVVSYSHDDASVDQTIEAFDGALSVYARALEDGIDRHLIGRPVQPVFRRFNGECI